MPKERPSHPAWKWADGKVAQVVDAFDEAERRPSDLHGVKISNSTPLQNFWESQENHTIA